MNINKQLTPSTITSTVLLMVLLALLFIPAFKGTVLRGLLHIGLFSPDTPNGGSIEQIAEFAAYSESAAIRFKDPQGRVITLGDQQGKVIFLNFWATWCPPCIAELPAIQKLHDKFRTDDRIQFMLVDADNDRAKAEQFMRRYDFTLPVYTPAGPIPDTYMDGSLPTTLVLNKSGQVVFKHEGIGNYSNKKFQAFITQLIHEHE